MRMSHNYSSKNENIYRTNHWRDVVGKNGDMDGSRSFVCISKHGDDPTEGKVLDFVH
jgi:hypothetical protein